MPDRAGFEGFYRDNLVRVVRACALVTLDRATAEDIAAESFTRLWSHWATINGPDHAGGYVFKTAMRLCAREGKRRRRPPIAAPPSEVPGIDAVLARDEIAAALTPLPVRQRQTVVLRDWAGFETAEVARMLGVRESTVRVHLARAREALRRSLSVEEME